jgi:hypothetical protein
MLDQQKWKKIFDKKQPKQTTLRSVLFLLIYFSEQWLQFGPTKRKRVKAATCMISQTSQPPPSDFEMIINIFFALSFFPSFEQQPLCEQDHQLQPIARLLFQGLKIC